MIITHELARRLEYAEALDGAACAEVCARICGDSETSVRSVAGGFCIYCGPASPLTHVLGAGLNGPVGAGELSEIEDFYRTRGAPVAIDVSPYADPSLRELLSHRGYQISEFNSVLVRTVNPAPEPSSTVAVSRAEDGDLYASTLMSAFMSRDEVTHEELQLGTLLYAMPGGTPFLAMLDGQVAGGCGLSARNGVAVLFGDATLPRFRKAGVQTAMITHRLREAATAACDIATASTQPGTTSQRNYQRLGFEVAYSKLTMVRA